MDYKYCFDDILIAQQAINDSLLLYAVVDDELLCDIYCIPSHNHQAFYVQVYRGDKFTLLFAKTHIVDHLGLDCVMYTFEDALKADKHIAYRGDIYCGMKQIPLSDKTMSLLLQSLPIHNELISGGIIIDGVTTLIRNHQHEPPIVLGYRDAAAITANPLSDEQKDFLDDLYLHIEQIIGNLLVSAGKMDT